MCAYSLAIWSGDDFRGETGALRGLSGEGGEHFLGDGAGVGVGVGVVDDLAVGLGCFVAVAHLQVQVCYVAQYEHVVGVGFVCLHEYVKRVGVIAFVKTGGCPNVEDADIRPDGLCVFRT